ncbi:hypothetical protein MSG28_010783 [Choristoneura fumiferana]|uniref:Uncharacterized protein n=1 Tax=Choristoneura fumiferana TaxID=7141 RepID=A0ACC0KNL2_CHOFU|nr:hypothetical protein MSG28_010783 [Choristoneura fumiferana]
MNPKPYVQNHIEYKREVHWRKFYKDDVLKNSSKKRAVDPVFHGHPKTKEELWNERFINESTSFDQTPSLISLIRNITLTYLSDCIPVILYDSQVKSKESCLVQNLLKDFPIAYVHGYINDDDEVVEPKILHDNKECVNFIAFLSDISKSAKILGKQANSKVIIVAGSSPWAVQEFLAGPQSRMFINLIVIGQSFKDGEDDSLESPYILYTHKLYTDGLGASLPVVLNSWSHGKFSRPVNLFPPKMSQGIKTDLDGGNPRVVWEGIEMKLLSLLAKKNNFSIEVKEPQNLQLGSGDAVAKEVMSGHADIGVAGLYVTGERIRDMDIGYPHSQDCAVFVTLMSTALPRYRAILGPFHWHVWLALTLTYLFGWYWVFTIIITSCYTGSIIAFVTLPVFPETIDTIQQLLDGFYRVGTLDRGGWEKWFLNSSDQQTNKLLKKVQLVPDVESGIRNTTKAFFLLPFAFLGSKAELEYIIQSSLSKNKKNKRAVLHISDQCFVPFGVSLSFPNNSIYSEKLSGDIARMAQSGLISKIVNEVRWEMQRSPSGKRLAASSGSINFVSVEEKGLTLADTQGMFLLLAAGFILGASALISEWMGGCSKKCRLRKKEDAPTSANSREHLIATPKSDINDGEIKVISNSGDRASSADSTDSLEGTIINLTKENISIHNSFSIDGWDSRRSSSVDIDREVKEIFEKDESRRRVKSTAGVELTDSQRQATASKGAFGAHLSEP